MSDNYTVLNPGVGGDVMDECAITYPDAPLTRKRPRVVIAGDNEAGELAAVLHGNPASTDYGLVTRNIPITVTVSSTTTVVGTNINTTLAAANSTRLGLTIYNDSDEPLFLKLGANASQTSFTIVMESYSYYEIPFGYAGIVDGVWASAIGNARVTELTG